MRQLVRIGMDTSKKVFQLHGVDAEERVALSRKLSRHQMIRFFEKLPPTVIGIEACGASHHWARTLGALGHEVRLMAPQLVKPYVRRSKNDAADAEALCEAMSRPTMRFVPAKTVEQQAALMLVGMREQLIGRRTQLANSIRGYAAEFGLTAPAGLSRVEPFLQQIASEETLPPLARDLFAQMAEEYEALMKHIRELDEKLAIWHRSQEVSRRLSGIPGIGPLGAALLLMKAPDPYLFCSGRDFAAWIGLTPRDHSSGGKVRHGGITRAGDSRLRSTLVVGATTMLRHVRQNEQSRLATPWLVSLLSRKKPKLAAVALANRMARIAWKLMTSGETYRKPVEAGAMAAADAS
ncbi:IS110 family transposase [Komagataeibacter sp. FNDCR1]|nr:IS110 family transposase [Komagataeibacter sp. FNDCR1]